MKCEFVKDFELYFYLEGFVLTNNQRYIIIFWSNTKIEVLDLIDIPLKITRTIVEIKGYEDVEF